MIRHRLRAALAVGVAVPMFTTASAPARAQWIVFDPTNYAAADLDAESRAHDAVLGRLGRAGTG
jgi:type IV secretion system protein TrbJ